MQPVLDHIDAVVRPALRKYLVAEEALTNALKSNDAKAVAARRDVMLAARQAVDVLHHLSDFVLNEQTARREANGRNYNLNSQSMPAYFRARTSLPDRCSAMKRHER